jgi:hypothetical protein
MFRLARVPFNAVRPLVAYGSQARRTFVSPLLLTRTWENENVASLRKEAKNRGLSVYVVTAMNKSLFTNSLLARGPKQI